MMMRNLIRKTLMILPVLLAGCITPYDLDYDIPDKEIVVDGLITDQPGPYVVRLTFTGAYTRRVEGANDPVTGAAIVIEDDAGNAELLTESQPGVYNTKEDGIRGTIGNTYTLNITLFDGTQIESYPEKLLPTPPIDSLYYEFIPEGPAQVQGHRIYAVINDPGDQMNYYRWKWMGYYLFTVIQGISAHVCLRKEFQRSNINIFSDRYFSGNTIRQPITLISHFANIYYLIQVYQQSLTESAYDFWSQVDEQGTQTGSIFDRIPSRISGNCYFSDGRPAPVYGYFGSSSILQKNLMMKFRPNAKPLYPRTYIFQPCTNYSNTEDFAHNKPDTWPEGWEFF